MAPQSGHVSNLCNLKRGPLEPLQLLSGQWHKSQAGALIQIETGCPVEIDSNDPRTSMFEPRIRDPEPRR